MDVVAKQTPDEIRAAREVAAIQLKAAIRNVGVESGTGLITDGALFHLVTQYGQECPQA